MEVAAALTATKAAAAGCAGWARVPSGPVDGGTLRVPAFDSCANATRRARLWPRQSRALSTWRPHVHKENQFHTFTARGGTRLFRPGTQAVTKACGEREPSRESRPVRIHSSSRTSGDGKRKTSEIFPTRIQCTIAKDLQIILQIHVGEIDGRNE